MAFDTADASCDALFVLDADCDWSTSPPKLSPLLASPEPQQPAPSVVASPVDAFPPTPVWLWSLDCDVAFPLGEDAFPTVLVVSWLVPVSVWTTPPRPPLAAAGLTPTVSAIHVIAAITYRLMWFSFRAR